MEKIYLTPEIEVVELETKTVLMAGSDYDPEVPPTTPTIPGGAGDDDLV